MQSPHFDLDQELEFDPETLREKYRRERDKRLRPDGTGRYVAPKGEFNSFVDEPTPSRVSHENRWRTRLKP